MQLLLARSLICGLAHARPPGGARHHQRTHSLVRNRQHDIHAGHNSGDAEQYLGAERAVNGDRRCARLAPYPARQNEQKTQPQPRPTSDG